MGTSEPVVLIAEDNPALLRVTRFSLERVGLRVDTASDGEQALQKLTENAYSVLVTDQQMPGLKGTEVIQRARRLPGHAETPVILLTAKALELSHEALAEELGVYRVLGKPFSPNEVSSLVLELVGEPV